MSDTKCIAGPARLSYCRVWEPYAMKEGQEKKYSVSVILPKKNKKLIALVNRAIEAAKKAGIEKFGSKWAKNLKMPLRDGDTDRDEDEAYEDSMFVNASSTRQPQIVDRKLQPIIDQEEVYSGVFAYVSINFYPFSVDGNKGIAAGLNNIMKFTDGERLAGASSASDDFADLAESFDDEDEDDDFM